MQALSWSRATCNAEAADSESREARCADRFCASRAELTLPYAHAHAHVHSSHKQEERQPTQKDGAKYARRVCVQCTLFLAHAASALHHAALRVDSTKPYAHVQSSHKESSPLRRTRWGSRAPAAGISGTLHDATAASFAAAALLRCTIGVEISPGPSIARAAGASHQFSGMRLFHLDHEPATTFWPRGRGEQRRGGADRAAALTPIALTSCSLVRASDARMGTHGADANICATVVA